MQIPDNDGPRMVQWSFVVAVAKLNNIVYMEKSYSFWAFPTL